jgi:hypothetical protein
MNLVVPSMALVKRELLTSLRRKRSFFLLLAVVSVVFYFFFSALLNADKLTFAYLARIAEYELHSLTRFLLFVGVLLVPAIAGASICVEKQQNSFDLLHASLIRPSGILFAKMINALALFFLMVLAILPIVGVSFFFVGIDWIQFSLSFLQIALTVTGCAAAGLLCSAWFYRTIPALVTAFFVSLSYVLNPLWLLSLTLVKWSRTSFGLDSSLEAILERTSAPFFLDLLYWGGITPEILACNLLYHAVFIFACLGAALLILRRPPQGIQVDTRKPIDDIGILQARRTRFPYYLIDPQRRREAIPDGRNPMYAKEMLSAFFGRRTHRVRIFYCSMVAVFLPVLGMLRAGGPQVGMVTEAMLHCQTLFLLSVIPLTVANALPKEYELGNVDALRITLLRPRNIVLGKLFGSAMNLAPFVLGATASTLLCIVFAIIDNPWGAMFRIVTCYAIMFVSLLCAFSSALYVSTFYRKTLQALVAVYVAEIALLLGVFVGTKTVMGFLFENRRNIYVSRSVNYSPMTNFFLDLSDFSWANPFGLCMALLVYFLLSLFVLNAAVRRFARQGHC